MITIIHLDRQADDYRVIYFNLDAGEYDSAYLSEDFDTLADAQVFAESQKVATLYAYYVDIPGYDYAEWYGGAWMTDGPDFDGEPIQGDLVNYLAELKQQTIERMGVTQ